MARQAARFATRGPGAAGGRSRAPRLRDLRHARGALLDGPAVVSHRSHFRLGEPDVGNGRCPGLRGRAMGDAARAAARRGTIRCGVPAGASSPVDGATTAPADCRRGARGPAARGRGAVAHHRRRPLHRRPSAGAGSQGTRGWRRGAGARRRGNPRGGRSHDPRVPRPRPRAARRRRPPPRRLPGCARRRGTGARPDGRGPAARGRAGEQEARAASLEVRRQALTLRSPVTAVVLTPRLEELVGRRFGSGAVAVRLGTPDSVELRVVLERAGATLVRPGQAVALIAYADVSHALRGRVASVATAAAGGAGDGQLEARVLVPRTAAAWRAGATGEAKITVRRSNLIGALVWAVRKRVRSDLLL